MKRNSVTDRNGSFRKVLHIAPSYGNFAHSGVTVRYGVTPDFSFPPQQESMMFKTKNQTDVAVTAALAKANDDLGLRDRIVTAMVKNNAEMKSVEAELERALEQLAVEEASLALTGDNSDNETVASAAWMRARAETPAELLAAVTAQGGRLLYPELSAIEDWARACEATLKRIAPALISAPRTYRLAWRNAAIEPGTSSLWVAQRYFRPAGEGDLFEPAA